MGCGNSANTPSKAKASKESVALASRTMKKVLETEMRLGPLKGFPNVANPNLSYIAEKRLQDGSYYTGQLNQQNILEGFGTVVYPSGEKYEGYFKDGCRNGKGRQIWVDGSWYNGEYFNGEREGFGTYHWANGEIYEGNWKENEKHGNGVYHNINGTKIEGEWNCDNPPKTN